MPQEEKKTFLALERTRLANERTFLAYVRTAISLLILGFASLHFFGYDSVIVAFGVTALVFGVLILAIGFTRFWSKREQMLSL
jgi:putative membrane protein